MTSRFLIPTLTAVNLILAVAAHANDPVEIPPPVNEMLQRYCLECHSDEEEKGDVNLQLLERPGQHLDVLKTMEWVLSEHEMPPRKAKKHPSDEEREQIVRWVQASIAKEKKLAAGDPGVVAMPRLNPSEYDHVIRDLTGHYIDLGQFLGSEGAAGEGFTNVGDAQPFSSVHLENYLGVGKKLLTYARITPASGFIWFPQSQGESSSPDEIRAQLWTEWKSWHDRRQNEALKTHLADLKKIDGLGWGAYLEAAWQYKHRAALGMPNATVADIAKQYDVPLFPSALQRTLDILEPSKDSPTNLSKNPFMKSLAKAWLKLAPSPKKDKKAARAFIKSLTKWHDGQVSDPFFGGYAYTSIEKAPEGPFKLHSAKIADGIWNFTIDVAAANGGHIYLAATDASDGNTGDMLIWQAGEFTFGDGTRSSWHTAKIESVKGPAVGWGKHIEGLGSIPEDAFGVGAPSVVKLKIPSGATLLKVQAALDIERGKDATVQASISDKMPDNLGLQPRRHILGQKVGARAAALNKSRQVASRFTSVIENQVTLSGKALLADLPPTTQSSIEIPKGRGASGPEERGNLFAINAAEIVATAAQGELAQRERIRTLFSELSTPAQSAMQNYLRTQGFKDIEEGELPAPNSNVFSSTEFQTLKKAYDEERRAEDLSSEKQIRSLAEQAWRRPATEEEIKRIHQIFTHDRATGATYETAMKHASLAVLISPHFLFRPFASQGTPGAHPLTPYELASRLSFFMWASSPDRELLARAADGTLTQPSVLVAQAKRMLSDPRARAMATEFAGQWLTFVAFDKNSTPDAKKFPEFTPSLRAAMYEESNLFILDFLRSNSPINQLINADYSFLNEELANHYGISGVTGTEMRKVKLSDSRRGGILTMGSVLIKHSSPLRTSPVKRGVWVYQNLMGVKIPEPPPVPLLSDDEKNEAGLNIAQQLALHRANPSCSSCHDRFDPLGLALENYDPVGRWRTKDGAGSPVVNYGEFPNGSKVESIEGLRKYLNAREDQISRHFCRMLLAYAVGRSLTFTDEPLIDEMLAAMKKSGGRPLAALELVVTSPQFTQRRDETPLIKVSSATPAN